MWVVPSATDIDPVVTKARALRPGGGIIPLHGIYEGALDGLFPAPQVPPPASMVAALMRHLSDPPAEARA